MIFKPIIEKPSLSMINIKDILHCFKNAALLCFLLLLSCAVSNRRYLSHIWSLYIGTCLAGIVLVQNSDRKQNKTKQIFALIFNVFIFFYPCFCVSQLTQPNLHYRILHTQWWLFFLLRQFRLSKNFMRREILSFMLFIFTSITCFK